MKAICIYMMVIFKSICFCIKIEQGGSALDDKYRNFIISLDFRDDVS